MQQSSFTILKSAYPELYQLAVEAEQYAHSDHSAFLLKIRIFLEIWCHEIAYKATNQHHIEPKLFDKIDQLALLDVIDHQLVGYLHNIRSICNQGVHLRFDINRGFSQTLEVEDNDINQCLSAIYRLASILIGDEQLSNSDGLKLSESAKLEACLAKGFVGDGKACLAAVKIMHKDILLKRNKSQHSEADIQYWLHKALNYHCLEALEFYAQLVSEKRYACFDLKALQHWLTQFGKQQQHKAYALIAAKTHEKLGDMPTALKQYNTAANDGCFHAIKRLQDHWVKRNNEEFYNAVQLGDRVNERRTVYFMLVFQLSNYQHEKLSPQQKADLFKQLKQQYIKAKSFAVEGLGYAEAIMAHYKLFDLPSDTETVINKTAQHWQTAPRFFEVDYIVFHDLFNSQIFEPFMVEFAQAILPFSTNAEKTAHLEYLLAYVQMQLTAQRKAFVVKRNSRELLKSASRAGSKAATELLVIINNRNSRSKSPIQLGKKWPPQLKVVVSNQTS